jgi:hypothetical protein
MAVNPKPMQVVRVTPETVVTKIEVPKKKQEKKKK